MFAWGGAYETEGDKLSIKVEFGWHEGWKGQTRVNNFRVDGKTLTLEATPFKSPVDGATVVTKLTLERME
jgi:hypothetical protein